MSFFSVVIPLYNKENHIQKTLNSVLSQSFTDFEIIIINDGSTDNSLDKVQEIKDSRINIYTTPNHGVSKARNTGILKSNSQYICFLDADDFWYENHLSQMKRLLDSFPECGLFATSYYRRINNILLKNKYHNIPNNEDWSGIIENYFDASLVNSIAWTSTVMVPKFIFDNVGFFDEKITLGAGEDTDMWIRIALKYPVAFNNIVTGYHNLDADNRITNSNTNFRQFINLDKYEDFTTEHKSLKKYLDLNRFSIGIQYKLAGNKTLAKTYFNKIESASLNFKQKTLTKLNPFILKLIIRIQYYLRKINFDLTAFK